MPIDINSVSSSCAQNSCEGSAVNVARSEATVAQIETGKPLTAETVTISEFAQQLRSLERSVATLPVVDNQRVDEVRQSIIDGSYAFSPQRVAEKFMLFEKQLPT